MSLARLAVGRLLGVPGVNLFRGVPYASASRFLPPEPVTAWGDLREARQHGPIPPQPATAETASRMQGEDCLSLTIATPGLPAPGAAGGAEVPASPVIVFLHGGLYQTGAGSLDVYDGAVLAGEGDCVVVSLNHRLGALGFLYLPGVAEGNMGLLDIVAALRWVRDHIGAFGGDPANVTLVGHEAGAHAALCLLTMWETQGLFHRAILQSPTLTMPPQSRDVASARAGALCALLKTPPEGLASLPLPALLAAQARVAASHARPSDIAAPFLPVFDHLADPARFVATAAEAAAARGIALILGTTREEMQARLRADPAVAALSPDAVSARFAATTGAAESMELYRRRRLGGAPVDLLADLLTDQLFLFPVLRFADALGAAGVRVWVYQMEWAPAGSPLGACHGIELPFVFATLPAHAGAPMLAGADPAECASLSAAMRAAWTEFAATDDPDAPGLPWPAYRKPARMTMRFGNPLGAVGDPAGAVWRGGVSP